MGLGWDSYLYALALVLVEVGAGGAFGGASTLAPARGRVPQLQVVLLRGATTPIHKRGATEYDHIINTRRNENPEYTGK